MQAVEFDGWKRSIQEKIDQAFTIEKAIEAGEPEIFEMDARQAMKLTLRIAISDCDKALQQPKVVPNWRHWFAEQREFCQLMMEEYAK